MRRRSFTLLRTPAAPQSLPELFRSIGIDRDYSSLALAGVIPDPRAPRDEPIFESVIHELRPGIVIEVGTWTGGSLLQMYDLSRRYGCDTQFIAVDTWLGSPEFWFSDDERARLMLVGGYPTVYRRFIARVLVHGAEDAVFPLPMTSTAAAHVLQRWNIVADAIYIDAGHEEEEVAADLGAYYALLRPGGILFGDDYHTRWPGLMRAVDAFSSRHRVEVTRTGAKDSKWYLRKPTRQPRLRLPWHRPHVRLEVNGAQARRASG